MPPTEAHWKELRSATPRHGSGIDAARVLFAEQQLREAAGWVGAEVPAATPATEADERHLLGRYNLAYVRLVAKIGEQWRPKRRPADLDELREWQEAALHRLVGGDLAGSGGDDDPLAEGGKVKGKKPLAAAT